MTTRPEEQPLVLVIDDDIAMRESLTSLFQSVGLRVKVFGSAPEFLQSSLPNSPSCLVLDIRLPGISGLEFQIEMANSGIHIPIVFMTGHGDIPMSVQAMKAGAVDFLTKPVRDKDLLDAIARAEAQDARTRQTSAEVAAIEAKIATLTPREREVFTHVIAGRLNKQIAGDLGTVEKTIKVHRGRMMEKLGVHNVVDLVRLAEKAGIAAHGK
jgi:FixJ family two-component response regulator